MAQARRSIDRIMQGAEALRNAELEVVRLRRELEETNRGVLALVAELDETARQWEATFDGIADAVCLVDESGLVTRVNAAAARLCGLDAEHAVGRTPDRVFPPAFARALRRTAGDRAHEVAHRDAVYELRRHAMPEPNSGEGVIVLTDVTERKRLEESRRVQGEREREAAALRQHALRMRELERVKSEFLKLASHELRGPMAVMKGYLAMIDDGSLGDLPAGMEPVVPVLTAKANEMDLLIEQMLETARLEDSRLMLNRRTVDLRSLVRRSIESVRPMLTEAHELKVELPPEPIELNVDPNRVTTIITNLLDNAIKYSPDGGAVRCALGAKRSLVEVSVHDQGLGIDPEDRPRLFTRFGRLVTRDNSHIPGTGLGLYLSRELARMHGGDIDCQSCPGAGSTFRLRLPLPA